MTMPNETNTMADTKNYINRCLSTPGWMRRICLSREAMLVWASTMRSSLYPTVRAKLLRDGHPETDIASVEEHSIHAAKIARHPVPKPANT